MCIQGGPAGQDHPLFGGPQTSKRWEKCPLHSVLVSNSYPDPRFMKPCICPAHFSAVTGTVFHSGGSRGGGGVPKLCVNSKNAPVTCSCH